MKPRKFSVFVLFGTHHTASETEVYTVLTGAQERGSSIAAWRHS